MTRLFGIAGVQMSVVPWDADATFEKMSDLTMNIHKQLAVGEYDCVSRADRAGTCAICDTGMIRIGGRKIADLFRDRKQPLV